MYEPYFDVDENAGILYGLALVRRAPLFLSAPLWPSRSFAHFTFSHTRQLASGYYSEEEPQNGFPHLTLAGAVEEQVAARNAESPGALHYIVHA